MIEWRLGESEKASYSKKVLLLLQANPPVWQLIRNETVLQRAWRTRPNSTWGPTYWIFYIYFPILNTNTWHIKNEYSHINTIRTEVQQHLTLSTEVNKKTLVIMFRIENVHSVQLTAYFTLKFCQCVWNTMHHATIHLKQLYAVAWG